MTDETATRLNDALAADLPAHVDEAALKRLRAVAHVMDEAVRVPGTDIRVGLDPLVSAVPVVGDVVSGGLSLYIVAESAYLGVSYTTLVRMLANIAVDVGGGSLPFVGPIFDALWKTNKRNVELLVDELESMAREPSTGGREPGAEDTGPVTIDVTEAE